MAVQESGGGVEIGITLRHSSLRGDHPWEASTLNRPDSLAAVRRVSFDRRMHHLKSMEWIPRDAPYPTFLAD